MPLGNKHYPFPHSPAPLPSRQGRGVGERRGEPPALPHFEPPALPPARPTRAAAPAPRPSAAHFASPAATQPSANLGRHALRLGTVPLGMLPDDPCRPTMPTRKAWRPRLALGCIAAS